MKPCSLSGSGKDQSYENNELLELCTLYVSRLMHLDYWEINSKEEKPDREFKKL